MNAERGAASLLLGVVLAACTNTLASPTPSGSSPLYPSVSLVTTPGPTIAPSALPAATVPTPQATPPPALTPSAASLPPPPPTPAPVSHKPTGVTFDTQEKDLGGGRYQKTATVTWRSPRSEGVEIRVYGVTECLSKPAPAPENAEGPCLVEHTLLPSSVLSLAATAPASAGTASWSWIEDWSGEGCQWYPPVLGPDGSWYRSVVLAAYSTSGHSIFAIAEPGAWYGGAFLPC